LRCARAQTGEGVMPPARSDENPAKLTKEISQNKPVGKGIL
jgi:hypothetical protein